jgi:hypothetical protein
LIIMSGACRFSSLQDASEHRILLALELLSIRLSEQEQRWLMAISLVLGLEK